MTWLFTKSDGEPHRASFWRTFAWDALALVCLHGHGVAAVSRMPDEPFLHLDDPAYLAILAGGVILVLVTILRFTRPRWSKAEQILLAMFLAGMPLVYMASGIRNGQIHGLPIEALGAVLFTALAVLGLRCSSWFLVGGIFAHGLLWDAWHGQPAGPMAVVPGWYAIACGIADVGLGIYATIQVVLSRGSRRRLGHPLAKT